MARIPDEEIERLKKEIPVEHLVTGFGVELWVIIWDTGRPKRRRR